MPNLPIHRFFLILALLFLAPNVGWSDATPGELLAMFNARLNGGVAISLHSPQVQGAPAQGTPQSKYMIRPFEAWDGNHYCVSDSHLLALALVDGPSEACPDLTYQDVQKELAGSELIFTVDGDELETMKTSIKHVYGDPKFWGFQEGVILPPGALSVGSHHFAVEFSGYNLDPDNNCQPTFISDVSEIEINIDAEGTGACLP